LCTRPATLPRFLKFNQRFYFYQIGCHIHGELVMRTLYEVRKEWLTTQIKDSLNFLIRSLTQQQAAGNVLAVAVHKVL